jgi:hypothetical protein
VIAAFALPAPAAVLQACVAGKPTPASYTWDFKGEANAAFREIQSTARDALNHADQLEADTRNPEVSWESHESQLAYLRDEIDGMGTKLCRLETIRRVVAPWQQREIDQIAANVQLMAKNAADAIRYVNSHQNALWSRTYTASVHNLFNEADALTRSAGAAAQFSSVSKEYRNLGRKLGARGAS